MSVSKIFKNTPCFDHHSDHLQGAHRFLVKVTEFKSFLKLWRFFVVLQEIGLKFEEETSKMLHLEHGFVWY
jgi:hypothetical protein